MNKQGGTLAQALAGFRALPWHERGALIAAMIRTCPRAETVADFVRANEDLKEQDAETKRRAIVDFCAKAYGLPLQPAKGPHDATDDKGRRVVIVGSWVSGIGYVLRGIVRERSKGKPFNWLANGQASTGAVQLAHIGEQAHVPETWTAPLFITL